MDQLPNILNNKLVNKGDADAGTRKTQFRQ